MKIGRLLFKPKWQDKDPAVRALAVASDEDAELQAALPELTRSDPDARVRLAALKRLGDYERWRERSTGDDDTDLRRQARAAYLALLCSDDARVPPLARRVAELETLSAGEIEAVVSSARDRDLRAAAFAYVSRPALLAERAVADPDPGLRRGALERVTDAAALERIAERTRKTDKQINRLARERLQALRIGAGDAAAIAEHARTLCERIEALLRGGPGAEPATQRTRLADEWNALGDTVPAPLATRFRASLALLDSILAGPPPAPAAQAAHESEQSSAPHPDAETASAAPSSAEAAASEEPRGEPEPAQPPQTGANVPQSDDQPPDAPSPQSSVEAASDAQAPAGHGRSQRKAALQRIEDLLDPYAARLDAGDVAAARTLHAQLVEASAAAGTLPSGLEHRLAPLHGRFAELARWQHWSNQRRRHDLCEEIEGLPDLALHPDALATRVRDAKAEWQKLDAMESAGATHGPGGGLTRRFYAACHHALKPAQTYFDKRDAVRDSHRRELEALLERVPATAADEAGWKAQHALRHELSVALRALDTVDPRQRSDLARRLKAAIATLSPRIEAHASGVRAAKARLIAQAEAQAEKPERNAVRAVRELQEQWKAVGPGAHGSDQRQWREFRAACDRVFDALGAERREREAQDSARVSQAAEVIAAAESLLADMPTTADELARARRELDARWRETGASDRALERRYRELGDALAAHAAGQKRTQRLARFTDALDRYRAVRALERGEASSGEVNETPGSALAEALEQRAARATMPDKPDRAAATEPARELLVGLEFAGGLPSPGEDRERRMNHQVARLSARMRGNETRGPEAELEAAMLSWFALGPLPDTFEERFIAAARAAIAALP